MARRAVQRELEGDGEGVDTHQRGVDGDWRALQNQMVVEVVEELVLNSRLTPT